MPLSSRHAAAAAVLSVSFASSVSAGVPGDAAGRAAAVGQPVSLSTWPASVSLVGPRARQQVIVTGTYADGSARDLTAICDMACESDVAEAGEGGYLRPRKDGVTALVVRAGGKTARVPVIVREIGAANPVSFRHELVAALNVGGCNAGACHGTPSGKNGFKLSLRGFDPSADYLQLTRDALNRRSDPLRPAASLVWQKATGRVPHEGGARFADGSTPGRVLLAWLSEGLRDDPAGLATVREVRVLPGPRVLAEPARWQQLAVAATFSDGSTREVTRLTVFSSSDPAVADVSPNGLVEFKQPGEIAVLCRYLEELRTVRLTYLRPRPGFVWPNPPAANYVDKHTFAKLKLLSLPPSDLCTDAEFVRRAYLDVCGILPTPGEAQTFLADRRADKRARLVDALLERPEYADFWALKWSDVFRSNRKAIQVKGVHVFQHWMRDHLTRNTGFDAVVCELLTASGPTFANPPANYYRVARDPQGLAETTAQLFFGVRMQCAKCHNHPFERWTQDDYYGMAAFFARVRHKPDPEEPGPNPMTTGGEVVYNDRSGEVTQPRTGKVMAPRFPGGSVAAVPPGGDRRAALAAWLTSGDNPFFARSVANRVWFHLNGKGIVDPVDDFRDSNPAANGELLDALAKDFVASGFDLKHLIRVVLNSRTYQLSAEGNALNRDDSKYFSHAVTKLLTAEQLLDALCTVTEVPEKFAGMPVGTRAIQLPDGDAAHPFLKTFGQPARELACECEREGDSNLAQALQLINGPTVNEKLRAAGNRIGRLLARKGSDVDVLNDLYLASLSRVPTGDDCKVALEHVSRSPDKRKAWEDVLWAVINSKEFLFRH